MGAEAGRIPWAGPREAESANLRNYWWLRGKIDLVCLLLYEGSYVNIVAGFWRQKDSGLHSIAGEILRCIEFFLDWYIRVSFSQSGLSLTFRCPG